MHIHGQEPLTASMLAAAPPQEQKQMIGGCPCFWRGSHCLTMGLRVQAGRLKCTRENLAARGVPFLDCSVTLL